MTRVLKVSVVLAMTVVGGWMAGCTTNATTGRRQFNLMSKEEEVQMGAQATPEITQQYGGKISDAAVQQYVNEIGQKLAATTEKDNPNLPWEFTLLDSDVINAFSLPGGKVFMTSGLAVKLKNEAQMAAVLGHEIGHDTARHVNDRMGQQAVIGTLGELAGSLLESKAGAAGQLAPQVINLGGQTVLLRFSRSQELEADALGMRYMAKAYYSPAAALGVQEVLQQAMKGNTTPEWFSTHPYPDTRIKAIQAALQKEYASTVNNADYKLNEAQYQQRLLKPLAGHKSPPPPAPKAAAPASGAGAAQPAKGGK